MGAKTFPTIGLDFVYILGNGSIWDDREIRYSLRSLAKYVKDRGNVWVIGEQLPWFQGINPILMDDMTVHKTLNGVRKIRKAAETAEISDPFVLMNDDFFFCKEVDQLGVYARGRLSDMLQKHPTKAGYYYRDLQKTMEVLTSVGITEPVDFEMHYPGVFHKAQVLEVCDKFLVEDENRTPLIRTLMGNIFHWDYEVTTDFKANKLPEFLLQRRVGREVISINDFLAGYQDFQTWVSREYAYPCVFENDEGKGLWQKPRRNDNTMRFYATVDFEYNGERVYQGNIIPDRVFKFICNNPAFNNKWRQA